MLEIDLLVVFGGCGSTAATFRPFFFFTSLGEASFVFGTARSMSAGTSARFREYFEWFAARYSLMGRVDFDGGREEGGDQRVRFAFNPSPGSLSAPCWGNSRRRTPSSVRSTPARFFLEGTLSKTLKACTFAGPCCLLTLARRLPPEQKLASVGTLICTRLNSIANRCLRTFRRAGEAESARATRSRAGFFLTKSGSPPGTSGVANSLKLVSMGRVEWVPRAKDKRCPPKPR